MQGAPDIRATAPARPPTAHGPAVAIEWRQAHQGCEFFDRNLLQFLKPRNEHLCQSGAHSGHVLKACRFLLPDRARLDQRLELGIKGVNLVGEPREMGIQLDRTAPVSDDSAPSSAW